VNETQPQALPHATRCWKLVEHFIH